MHTLCSLPIAAPPSPSRTLLVPPSRRLFLTHLAALGSSPSLPLLPAFGPSASTSAALMRAWDNWARSATQRACGCRRLHRRHHARSIRRSVTTTGPCGRARAVPVQMWQRCARSRCRCGRGEPSPGADVARRQPEEPSDECRSDRVALGAKRNSACARGCARARSTSIPRQGAGCVLHGLCCMMACVRAGAQRHRVTQKEGRTHRR